MLEVQSIKAFKNVRNIAGSIDCVYYLVYNYFIHCIKVGEDA